MRDGHDENPGFLDSVDNTKWKSAKEVASVPFTGGGPSVWPFQNRRLGFVKLGAESSRRRWTSLRVPPRCRFGFDYRLLEVLKR
jgi:hypothetical protein